MPSRSARKTDELRDCTELAQGLGVGVVGSLQCKDADVEVSGLSVGDVLVLVMLTLALCWVEGFRGTEVSSAQS